jgi:hypothetical protein
MKQSKLQELFSKHKFRFFTLGDFNLNIFGVRKTDSDRSRFDDLICIAYSVNGKWKTYAFDATTSPGIYRLGEKMGNEKGTAILRAGYQYRFKIGTHRSRYGALVQAEEFTVIRDNDKDGELSLDEDVERGTFGINLHHASGTGVSSLIGEWSWGCQVIASIFKWRIFWALIVKSSAIFGKYFTYSLFNESDLGMSLVEFKDKMNYRK